MSDASDCELLPSNQFPRSAADRPCWVLISDALVGKSAVALTSALGSKRFKILAPGHPGTSSKQASNEKPLLNLPNHRGDYVANTEKRQRS